MSSRQCKRFFLVVGHQLYNVPDHPVDVGCANFQKYYSANGARVTGEEFVYRLCGEHVRGDDTSKNANVVTVARGQIEEGQFFLRSTLDGGHFVFVIFVRIEDGFGADGHKSFYRVRQDVALGKETIVVVVTQAHAYFRPGPGRELAARHALEREQQLGLDPQVDEMALVHGFGPMVSAVHVVQGHVLDPHAFLQKYVHGRLERDVHTAQRVQIVVVQIGHDQLEHGILVGQVLAEVARVRRLRCEHGHHGRVFVKTQATGARHAFHLVVFHRTPEKLKSKKISAVRPRVRHARTRQKVLAESKTILTCENKSYLGTGPPI